MPATGVGEGVIDLRWSSKALIPTFALRTNPQPKVNVLATWAIVMAKSGIPTRSA